MAQFDYDIFSMEFHEDGITPLESISVIPDTHTVTVSTCIQQMHKSQDQTYEGTSVDDATGETFHYGMVTDGHGGDGCIQYLRSLSQQKLAEIIGKRNPVETMAEIVNKNVKGAFCGGATMCLAKVYKDRIECINCGDSRVAIFKNGELIYLSNEHNWENQEERDRIIAKGGITFTPSRHIKIINKTQMVSKYSEYAKWESDNTMLACTQALGSNGKTGYAPDHEIIPIIPGESYKVVIGSDGIWDMIIYEDIEDITQLANMNATEGVTFIISRWLQEWEMQEIGETEFYKARYTRNQCDDVCMVAMDITPV